MTKIERVMIALLTIGTIAGVTAPLYLPRIHAWERANNYPYGKLCELYRNCD